MLDPGTKLGPYEILAPLGAGGMGEVYRARDARLAREVAIKVLPPEVADRPETLARFEREARAVAALSHPNILAVHDLGTDHGVAFVVMELLEGTTLRARMSGGPMPLPQALDVALQVAKGLRAAHEKGIVHRDVKPDNVFVSRDGHVKLLDFGLAKKTRDAAESGARDDVTATHRTAPGTVLGTLGYMSPEQVRGEPADARADVFAFGAMLYEMLAGRRAFGGRTAVDAMAAILAAAPEPVAGLRADVPAALDALVSRCLEKEPARRFASAAALVPALLAIPADRAAPSMRSPAARRTLRFAAAGLAAVLVIVAGVVAARQLARRAAPRVEMRAKAVAMLEFENLSKDPALDWMGRGLPELLGTALSRSPDLDVYDPQRLVNLLRGPGAGRDADGSVYDRLREHGVGRAVVGSILRSGSRVAIACRVMEVESGRVLHAVEVEGAATDDLFLLAGGLIQKLQAALAIDLAGAEAGDRWLREITTSSADAFKLFLRGRAAFIDARWREAAGFYEQSLALDANFVAARVDLTGCYWNLDDGPRTKESLEIAKRMRAHASPRDAMQLEMIDAVVAHDPERLVRVASTLRELYPENRFFTYLLGRGYYTAGSYDRCIATLAPLVGERYAWGWTYVLSGRSHEKLGQLDEARRSFELGMDVTRRNPEVAFAFAGFLGDHGDAPAARALLVEASRAPALAETPGVERLIHLALGKLDESEGAPGDARKEYEGVLATAPAGSDERRTAAEGFKRLANR